MPEPSVKALAKEREKVLISALVVLLLVTWLGFPIHRADRFAGSLWGGVLGVTGSLLMLVPLVYMVVKRIPRLKKAFVKRVRMRTFLTWHIYAGVFGPILVVVHSGHKYESTLGIVLTATTILVVLSGFVGRYLMTGFSREIREKKKMLTELEGAYERAAQDLAQRPLSTQGTKTAASFFTRFTAALAPDATRPLSSATTTPLEVARLTGAMADVEYAIRTHEKFKAWFGKWLDFHIVISLFLYGLMALHVYNAVYFGLRWLE